VVAVLFGGHTVVSYVLSDTFQLVEGGVLQIEKGSQANVTPHEPILRLLSLPHIVSVCLFVLVQASHCQT